MPELPEVETVARQLAPLLVGRTVRGVRLYDERLREARLPRVAGRRIVAVARSGKRVLFELSPGRAAHPLWLAVHLRMTGRLIWTPDGERPQHLRARLTLDRGHLLFIDARRFGTWNWYADALDAAPDGLDPLSPELTPRVFDVLIGTSEQNVKVWLLRQDRLVGLGNIYASEILHAAGISPERAVGSLTPAERRALLGATRRILVRAIHCCGTTFSDFQDARGVEGGFQRFLRVYDREDAPCRRCPGTIRRAVQQQRSTYWCPRCQA